MIKPKEKERRKLSTKFTLSPSSESSNKINSSRGRKFEFYTSEKATSSTKTTECESTGNFSNIINKYFPLIFRIKNSQLFNILSNQNSIAKS